MLHATARVVQEMGKSRAAAFALGIQDIDEGIHINTFADSVDSLDSDSAETSRSESNSLFLFYYSISCFTPPHFGCSL